MQIDRVLGNVGVLYVGEYDPEKHYEYLNCATHNGSSYTCVNPDGVTGIEPGTTDDWQLSAKKGDVGPVGPKPVNGVDYNTPEEKEEFKNDVVNKATEEVKGNIAAVETEAIENYNENATQKTTEYDTNASNKLKAYNDNTTTKLKEYNDNASSKVEEYNTNANTQTETFNTNASTKTTEFDTNATNKTNAFNENYDEKLADINEASTSIEQERVISDGKYARALKTKVEDVEQAQIYAENDEVKNLIIKGAELTQKTREGYNLVDFKSPDEIYVSDFNFQNDILTITSSSGSFRQIIYDITNLMLANAGKVLSFWYSNIDFSQGKSPAIQITLEKNDGTKSYTQLLSASLVKSNFNIPDNISEYSSLKLGVFCNNTSESSNASITITKPMLLIGTEEKPYEQYGASPSLDYPSEIQVADEQNIQITKNNYLDTTQIANKTFSNGGLTVTIDENGIFTVNGTNTNQVNIDFNNLNFKVKEGQKLKIIKISGDISQSDNILNYINVLLWDKNYNTLSLLNSNNSNVNYTDIVNRIQVRFIIPSSTSSITYTNFKFGIMVLDDENIEEYKPYIGINISIPLQNSAIGDYFDVIDRENNRQYKIVQELILNGDETDWGREDTAVGTRFFKPLQNSIISNANKAPYALCTHFKLANDGGTYNTIGNLFAIYTINTAGRIAFGSFTDISTVDEWKAKLKELYEAGTPVKVYYVAKTSKQEPLSEEVKQELDKFKLYDDLNNVFIDKGSLSFKYNKSLLRAFKEQSELSASLLDRIQALEAAQVNSVGGN